GAGSGILNVLGNVVLSDETTFVVALNGAAAGSGYDQLKVTGTVDLHGSMLSPSLGFAPAGGATFTIITSTAPIVGTVAGLPEGTALTIGNRTFTITYAGGGGHDVVLTEAGTVPAPTVSGLSPSSGSEAGGTVITITGTGFTGATEVDFGAT